MFRLKTAGCRNWMCTGTSSAVAPLLCSSPTTSERRHFRRYTAKRRRHALAEHLTARIPAGYLQYSGFAKITVQNPVPFLKTSEVMFLRIDGIQPTITEVIPGSATIMPVPPSIKPCPPDDPTCTEVVYRMTMPVVVNGTNITPQTEYRIFRSVATAPPFSQGAVFVGPTQLYVNWDVTPNSIGAWYVQIKNPEPGGGVSEQMAFILSQGNFVQNPFILTISPSSVSAGGPSFTLSVFGVNFKSGSQINFSSIESGDDVCLQH